MDPVASAACILIAGILVIVPKQKTEVLPLAGHSIPEIRSAEMEALLIKTDGEQVMLGKESRQLKEKNGMLIPSIPEDWNIRSRTICFPYHRLQ